jgi:tetratricopeptide (TPR) repeat protein
MDVMSSVCVLLIAAAVTFSRDVAPILFAKCVQCHYAGGPAPFALDDYESARRRATLIARVTARRLMPPWKADPAVADYVGQAPLTDDEIGILARWVADGAVEGDSRDVPPRPQRRSDWQLGVPDLVVTLPSPFILKADGGDVFRIFVAPIPTSTARYVRGIEFRTGNTRAVHHAQFFLDRTSESRQRDAADPLPGYDGLLARSAVYPDGFILGWTPGQLAPLPAAGLSWRLEPGTDLVMKLHLTPTGRPESVQPSLGFYFADEPPTRTPAMLRLGRQDIAIPAGASRYEVSDSYALPADVEVHAIQPHAHYRARRVVASATLPDGATRPLVVIDDWDYRWQHVYRFAEPVVLPKGSTIAMHYVYDNSAGNPRNPDLPPRHVEWGQLSSDEMGDLWVQVLTRNDADRRVLADSFARKAAAEDIVGYEHLIRRDPDNSGYHDDVALIYLEIGRPDAAAAHFARSAALNPRSARAHFNLGTALALANQTDRASHEFDQALNLDSGYGPAHANLGELLLRAGQVDDAVRHLTAAIAIDDRNAEAHFNLAAALQRRGESGVAVAHLRRAVEMRPDWASALASLAWLLAATSDSETRDPAAALQFAERAAAVTMRQDAAALDTLAVTCAATGDYNRATAVADEALRLTPPRPLAAEIEKRRALFERRQSFVIGMR